MNEWIWIYISAEINPYLHVWGGHWEQAAVQLWAFWMQVVLVHGQCWAEDGHQITALHMTTTDLGYSLSKLPPTCWLCTRFKKGKSSPWPEEESTQRR